MKRVWRKVLCVVLVLLLCGTLTGCDMIDSMREAHAFWRVEEGAQPMDSFEWNGAVYKRLPEFDGGIELSISEIGEVVYVTQPDVPVLLSQIMGATAYMNKSGVLAEVELSMTTPMSDGFYCRTDRYDTVVNALTTGEIEFNSCVYYWYDYENFEEHSYTLSDLEYLAVQTVCNTVEPELLPWDDSPEMEYYAFLYESSEDGVFQRPWVYVGQRLGTYYVLAYDEETETVMLYVVPQEHVAAIESLLKAAKSEYEQYGDTDLSDIFL